MALEVKLFASAYGLAAFGFLILAGLLVVRPIRSNTGRAFLAATLASCLTYTLVTLTFWFPKLVVLRPISSLPIIAWGAFLIVCLRQVTAKRISRLLAIGMAVFWVVDVLVQLRWIPSNNEIRYLTRIGIAILAMICAEQLIRNSDTPLRWATKHIVLAVVLCAGYDLAFYAYGLVQGNLDPSMAILRGVVWVIACPLLAVSAARNPSWDVGIHVSRNVVFHSLTVFAVGGFLFVIGVLGYLVTRVGLEWASIFQGIVIVGGLAFGATALMSRTFRSRIRGFIDKNFYSYRFDYREEWLRFTSALTNRSDTSVFATVNQAFQTLIDTSGGALYLRRNSGDYEVVHQYGVSGISPNMNLSTEISNQLQHPIDLAQSPTAVRDAFLGATPKDEEVSGSPARFVIPLTVENDIVAFVVTPETRTGLTLDREVTDLLSVAARQAASYIQQALTTEELVVARQFDSFNKMSAFVVHDLKNLAAQLSLMSSNAERHKDNPEFQRDMIETVQHVTTRMRLLLEQLANGTKVVDPPAVVDVYTCIDHALRLKPSLATKPIIEKIAPPPVHTIAHEDRLARIIGHLVQNADEATRPPDGSITIRVDDAPANAVKIEVADNGCGMTESFIRERLFRPFASTKESGMGIGVFESANYLRDIGGSLRVVSALNRGTKFTIELPKASMA